MFTNILNEVKQGSFTEEKGKVYVKTTGTAPVSSNTPTTDKSYSFLRDPETTSQQLSNVISFSDYMHGTPEKKPEMQQNNNLVSLTDYKKNKEQQTQENSGKWAA
jgi:hypothetical protein